MLTGYAHMRCLHFYVSLRPVPIWSISYFFDSGHPSRIANPLHMSFRAFCFSSGIEAISSLIFMSGHQSGIASGATLNDEISSIDISAGKNGHEQTL